MKTFLITGLLIISGITISCSRDGDVIEREEEMNRDDMAEDSYKQSDIHPGNKPSNIGD
jgi:hypothetical protein